ncbi:serine threonine- kinase PLK1 [Paramuricea clavata]|uniref:Serine/threonine-protein kinase PLK n=2 Tax=Paramuricea clavata TaxID=317549 RepID=A0A6S7IYA6_PARCT|nr:serine threonine- kinase PLK1 [Paramuricea clavata]
MLKKGPTSVMARHVKQEDFTSRSSAPKEIGLEVTDPKTRKKYIRGKFLGKGGFAKCYELQDKETNHVYAGKIVPKTMLTKPHQKEKMAMEIDIHRKLHHKHVVGFHCFFEDDDFIYILLEICRRRSLMELHKRRKALTEPETRYYLKQILIGCIYLHDAKIIHRDLKLGNLFLDNDMNIKIGDFGLATTVQSDKERKRTLCGTPNYIAPEVLSKKGHSFEVDVWSLGCIMYTLLVGKPPFETSSLKETYNRIKRNEYYIPSKVGSVAQKLIVKMLRPDPVTRPTMHEIYQDEFFRSGYLPTTLPPSSLSMAPRFNTSILEPKAVGVAQKDAKVVDGKNALQRRPLFEINHLQPPASLAVKPEENRRRSHAMHVLNGESRLMTCEEAKKHGLGEDEGDLIPTDFYLSDLCKQLTSCLATKPAEVTSARPIINPDDAEDPACNPIFWISKWVDYSDKYGLGYQLCDGSVGVLFNDSSRLILKEDGE